MKQIRLVVLLRIFLASLYMIVCVNIAKAQNTILDSISGAISHYQENSVTEKLFVHLDRDFYMKGETIWFKVWSLNAANNQPMNLSKAVYIELLNSRSASVLRTKISLIDGKGEGSLEIPSDLLSARYTFRAYTAYMKNFPPDFYFHQEIVIVNAEKRPVFYKQNGCVKYICSFFPEGGKLIHGIETKIGCKATDLSGKGVTYKGCILGGKGDTLQKFRAHKFGMGSFTFTPLANEKYKAVWQFDDSTIVINKLPEIAPAGYTMQLSERDQKNITVEVHASAQTEGEEMYLVVSSREKLTYAQNRTVENGKCYFKIDPTKFGKGMSCLTLFNSHKNPVCERLYFTIPDDTIPITVSFGKEGVFPRNNVSLELQVDGKDTTDQNKINLSMAIYLFDSLQGYPEANITNYLWLNSALKGYVQSPEYYFTTSDSAKEALENLLITQGWRTYDWKNILLGNSNQIKYSPDFEKPCLQAKIINNATGLPAANISAFLTIPAADNYFYCSKSNNEGDLIFPLKHMEGTQEIILQMSDVNAKLFHLEIKDDFSQQTSNRSVSNLNVAELPRQDLRKRLINANVNASFNVPLDTGTADGKSKEKNLFYGKPDNTYFLDNYTRFITMEEVLREYVSEVAVRRSKGNLYCRVYDQKAEALFQDEPLYLLDGLPVFDAGRLMKYDPRKIERMEIVARRYFLGPLVSEGILSLFTYKSDLKDFALDPSAIAMDFQGLERRRHFYTPSYTAKVPENMADRRNLLYWNPNIDLIEGRTHVQFSTSFQTGTYAVVINGISASGKTISHVSKFQVTLPGN